MVYKRGFVANVVTRRSGSNLVQDAAAGASEIWVSDVSDFKLEGGTLVIEGDPSVTLGYVTVDPYEVYTPGVEPEYKHKITLSSVLAEPHLIDSPVLISPPSSRKWAYVELGEAGTNIRVEVPFEMREKFPDGLREYDDREAVTIDNERGVWQITNVVDEIPVIPASSIDLEDSGIVTDPTTPPPASPLPTVDAGSGAAVVRWVNADLAIQYDLYISTDNSVAPGPSSLHTLNVHSPTWVTNMPNGDPIPTDSDVYFALVASNAIGPAAPSAWVSGRAGLIEDSILSASVAFIQTVITELVETQGLQIGDHTWNEQTGLTIPGVVNFPPDQGDAAIAQIWAKMIARSLTVENYLSIRGINNEFAAGSVTKLSLGASNPTVAPTVSQSWPIEAVGALAVKGTYSAVAGDPTWTGSGSRWLLVNANGKSARVWENGVAVGNTWVPEDNTIERIQAVCKGNNCWWILTQYGTDNTFVMVYKVANTLPTASWIQQSVCPILMPNTAGSGGYLLNVVAPLGSDLLWGGGEFGIIYPTKATSTIAGYKEFTLGAGGSTTPTLVEQGGFDASSTIVGAVYQKAGTDNPYGQAVMYIAGSGSGLSAPSGSRVEAVTYNVSTGAFTSIDRYNLSNGMPGNHLTWVGDATDPDGALLCSLTSEGSELPVRVTKYSKYMNWSSHEFCYTWYDNDAGGTGTHETAASPVYQTPAGTDQAAKMARSWMLVTPTPANDQGGADNPNSHRIYCSNSVGGTKRLQGETGVADGTFRFTYSGASSTTPPVTNNFPGATPAVIQSDKTDSNGALISLKGDGSGRMGPFAWDTNGVATTLYDTGWVDVTFSGTWQNFETGTNARKCQVRRIGKLVIHRGIMKGGALPGDAWSVPAQFRMQTRTFAEAYFPCVANSGFGAVAASASTGIFQAVAGSNVWFDISGVVYLVE